MSTMPKAGLETTHEFCFVYATYPDADTAVAAGRALTDGKLAACVNIHPPMLSIYEWQGKREEVAEVAVFIKTRRTLAAQVIAALKAIHPYSTPCFLMLPIEGGNADYLAWARLQTAR